MSTALESRMQHLTLLDASTSSNSSESSESSTSQPQARRQRRPQFHKRLHPSHADIPFVPEARDTAKHRYWHFGWPLSDQFVDNFLDKYIPGFLDSDRATVIKYGQFMCVANTLAGTNRMYLVLVEPDAEFAPSQSPLADPGEKASTFLMVVSDCSTRYFTKRPTKKQMARLMRMFGSTPRWMMDARDKSRFTEYGYKL
ncbi:hypothetical protein GGF50DRAFT_115475 [Schizophyllum commune]